MLARRTLSRRTGWDEGSRGRRLVHARPLLRGGVRRARARARARVPPGRPRPAVRAPHDVRAEAAGVPRLAGGGGGADAGSGGARRAGRARDRLRARRVAGAPAGLLRTRRPGERRRGRSLRARPAARRHARQERGGGRRPDRRIPRHPRAGAAEGTAVPRRGQPAARQLGGREVHGERPAPPRAGPRRLRPDRPAGGAAGDDLRPGGGRPRPVCARRRPRGAGRLARRAARARGLRLPPRAGHLREREPDRRRRAGEDEAGRVPGQHRARDARGRGRAGRGARLGPARRGRARRLRGRRPPPAPPRQRRPHPPPRRRDARDAAPGCGDDRGRDPPLRGRRAPRQRRQPLRGHRVSDELLLAIDAGTGSARAVLFTPDGAQVGIGQREYSHPELPGVPGSQVFATDENWRLICECVRDALAASGASADSVKAVGATSMREGMVLYDARGDEIWACPNVDSRARDQASELVRSGAAQEIYDHAGDWVAITAPARFLWIARHEPDVFASIAHVGMLGDWILRRLSGVFVTDPSLGSSSGMFELAERDWSERVLDLCGLDRSIFPSVVEPGTVVGGVSAAAAAQTGLRKGTPVVVSGADTQLGLLGIGVTEPGRFAVVGGSFWQSTVILDAPTIDPQARLRTLCHCVPDRWMIEGIGFYCGIVMRWFRDAFCELEKEQAAREGIDAYTLLEGRAAELPPGSNGVFGIFSNLMHASRWIHASPAFIGFDVSNSVKSSRYECFRAIEESAAYVARGHRAIVEEITGLEVEKAVLTGGAAKGALWPQIVADTLGLPVCVPEVKESTALGAAIYAGVGAGVFADAAEAARELARFERIFEPDPAAVAAYDDLYARWLELYRRSLELSESGLVRPLWRAAGA